MAMPDTQKLQDLGRRIGEYVQCQSGDILNTQVLHGVIADLTSEIPELQAPLRDLVTRQGFTALFPYARSGNGIIQRDALIQEMKYIYQQDILTKLEEVLNGFLGITERIASSSSSPPTAYGFQKGKPPSSIKSDSAENAAVTMPSSVLNHYAPPQSKSPRTISPSLVLAVASIVLMGLFFAARNQDVMHVLVEKPVQEIDSSEDSQLNELADEIFWRRHPSLKGKKLTRQDGNLVREWLQIRECEAVVDREFYKIYPYMKGRLIKENQVEMVSRWKNLYDTTPGCSRAK